MLTDSATILVLVLSVHLLLAQDLQFQRDFRKVPRSGMACCISLLPIWESYLCRRRTGRHRYHATRPQTRQQQRLSAQEHPYPLTGLDQPVYSLATLASTGGTPTMNIVTYCAPMSIQPRTVALGLFKGTQSWENFLANKVGVLQVGASHIMHA